MVRCRSAGFAVCRSNDPLERRRGHRRGRQSRGLRSAFARPASLATDEASIVDVLLHAIDALPERERLETSPSDLDLELSISESTI